MSYKNFAEEGITANSLTITSEHADLAISCCHRRYNEEKGRLEFFHCKRNFLHFDMSHDEGFLCPHCTYITGSGLPVCKLEKDKTYLQHFGCYDEINTELEYAKPQVWVNCGLKFRELKDAHMVEYSFISDDCGRKCFSITFDKFCRDFDSSRVKVCSALGEVFSNIAVGCREKNRILKSI